MGKVVPNLQLFLILVLISFLILALDSLGLLNWPKRGLYFLTNPISFGLYSTRQSLGKQLFFIYEARRAGQENKALQDQLGKLLSENADLRKRLAESEALVSQEQHLDAKIYHLIPARPIGLDRYLKIDQGSNKGIQVGQAVVFQNNYLGQVVEVNTGGANVKLLVDPDSKLAAFSLVKDGRAKGVVVGQFGVGLLMDKILHEESISAGDLVYSEGTEGFLPRGLILGKVVKVEERENQVFKQAKVEPLFDIRDLELVFVIAEP